MPHADDARLVRDPDDRPLAVFHVDPERGMSGGEGATRADGTQGI